MFKSQKLVQVVTEPIMNSENKRAFDFVRTQYGLFLQVKCSDKGDRHKYVMICITDVLYQVWKKLTPDERRQIWHEMEMVRAGNR